MTGMPAAGRETDSRHRGRPRIRQNSLRPRPRARLRLHRREHHGRGHGVRARHRAERHPAGPVASRRLRSHAARSPEAQSGHASHSRAHGVGRAMPRKPCWSWAPWGSRSSRSRTTSSSKPFASWSEPSSSASAACWSSRTTSSCAKARTKLLELDGVVIEAWAPPPTHSRNLATQSYDCVVLDLNLPDASGYDILETMAGSEQYSFPPVIIYTGRDISRRGRGAAPPFLAIGHRQRRALAGAAARRGDAVPAPGRIASAARSRSGCCARRGSATGVRGQDDSDRRRRRAQHLRADERVRAARAHRWRSRATDAKDSNRSER